MINKKSYADQKYEELLRANAKVDVAIDLAMNTINRLEAINAEIQTSLVDIDMTQKSLQNTQEEMVKTQKHNSAIVSKFKELLAIEE